MSHNAELKLDTKIGRGSTPVIKEGNNKGQINAIMQRGYPEGIKPSINRSKRKEIKRNSPFSDENGKLTEYTLLTTGAAEI